MMMLAKHALGIESGDLHSASGISSALVTDGVEGESELSGPEQLLREAGGNLGSIRDMVGQDLGAIMTRIEELAADAGLSKEQVNEISRDLREAGREFDKLTSNAIRAARYEIKHTDSFNAETLSETVDAAFSNLLTDLAEAIPSEVFNAAQNPFADYEPSESNEPQFTSVQALPSIGQSVPTRGPGVEFEPTSGPGAPAPATLNSVQALPSLPNSAPTRPESEPEVEEEVPTTGIENPFAYPQGDPEPASISFVQALPSSPFAGGIVGHTARGLHDGQKGATGTKPSGEGGVQQELKQLIEHLKESLANFRETLGTREISLANDEHVLDGSARSYFEAKATLSQELIGRLLNHSA